jgi:1,4-alpha-glucan branching enzyme
VAFGAYSLQDRNGEAQVAGLPYELTPVANTTADPADIAQPIQFLLIAPSARSVSLVGQFNGWDAAATPMTFDKAHGAWYVTLPLTPGLYQYQFVLDGAQRVTDPSAPQVSSDFGSPNSLLTVRGKE